jgi:hypothetical protein
VTREVTRTAHINISENMRVAFGVKNFMAQHIRMFADMEEEWLEKVPHEWKPEVDGRCDLGQSDQPCWGVGYEFRNRHDVLDHTLCEGHKPLLEDRPYLQRRVLA